MDQVCSENRQHAKALSQDNFTAYSLRQILEHSGYRNVQVFPLHLFVFRKNPLNYIAWGAAALLHLVFRATFVLYGKSNKLWTKKIAAVGIKGARSA